MTQQIERMERAAAPAKHTGRAKVSVLYTSANTVIEDIGRLMRLAGYTETLDRSAETLLKINISWQRYFPACSTSPWQLDGVIQALKDDGYDRLIGAHNGTVVVNSHEGSLKNKHDAVLDKHGVHAIHLNDDDVQWIRYEPRAEMLVLHDIFTEGIYIPQVYPGKNIVHMPTLKTHVFTTMTGAMKNAFGGLLNFKRHWTHSRIHETLVDLLAIQQEIHPGIFAVMDGTIAGDGPGPRAMRTHVKNVILAGADQVAVDAVAAKMMGFDPLSIDFIRLATERGLGQGDPELIDIEGLDISGINFGFSRDEDTFASWGQKKIYWGPLKPFESMLLRTPIVPWAYWASNFYYNVFWWNLFGRSQVSAAMKSEWGRLFASY
ncbi:MAG: DUF362 domain-containing protein [Dehalococcoidia bacterium]